MWINADLAQLTDQDSVVLANNRQVLAFKKTWGLQHGTSALPQTFAWKQYLQHTWKATNPNSSKRLISAIESRTLIAQSMTRLGQTVDTRLLDEVVKNIDYCHAHLINPTQLIDSHHQNSELFSTWMLDYQQTKLTLNVLDVNDLSKLILNRDRKIKQPYLYGFKTLTPEQLSLFVNIGHQVLSANQPNTVVTKPLTQRLMKFSMLPLGLKICTTNTQKNTLPLSVHNSTVNTIKSNQFLIKSSMMY